MAQLLSNMFLMLLLLPILCNILCYARASNSLLTADAITDLLEMSHLCTIVTFGLKPDQAQVCWGNLRFAFSKGLLYTVGANATLLVYNLPQMLSLNADQRGSMKLTFVHLFSATDIDIPKLKKASWCFVGISPLKLVRCIIFLNILLFAKIFYLLPGTFNDIYVIFYCRMVRSSPYLCHFTRDK